MKTQMGTRLKDTYQKVHRLSNARGLKPKIHILDNECATSFKEYMDGVGEAFQLAPPPHTYTGEMR